MKSMLSQTLSFVHNFNLREETELVQYIVNNKVQELILRRFRKTKYKKIGIDFKS